MEIEKLSPREYVEKKVSEVFMDNFKGPHCLNLDLKNNRIVFDYYNDEFSLFAGVKRIKARFNKI